MDSRKVLYAQAMGIMVVLCLIWGLQQLVLKAADVSPLMQIALRTGIAAVLVGLLMLRQGPAHPLRRRHLAARLAGRRGPALHLGLAHGGISLHCADLRRPRPALETVGRAPRRHSMDGRGAGLRRHRHHLLRLRANDWRGSRPPRRCCINSSSASCC